MISLSFPLIRSKYPVPSNCANASRRTLVAPDDARLDATFEESFAGAEFDEGLAAFRARRGAQSDD